ncbi:hypothetical protein B0J11DRAFT_275403 [Dendryphion nanum]|uniref:Uncharacterized protein n=1 Tax=Dendryphion nanum TaxID=256645 RepID=A0A9P9E0R0_9PLEO|nr:hypothetical protein B0J11DRAFT_275403 [Dendryphion nanum]
MSGLTPPTPSNPFVGLPASPRPSSRPTLSPLDTSSNMSTRSSTSEKTLQGSFNDNRERRRDSLIFVNATIPLSPPNYPVYQPQTQAPFDGLAPRKRNAFARLFCCFGREERARRNINMRFTEYEQVGEKNHWSEY